MNKDVVSRKTDNTMTKRKKANNAQQCNAYKPVRPTPLSIDDFWKAQKTLFFNSAITKMFIKILLILE